MVTEMSTGMNDISGKWMNTRTGQVVYARNIVNDGDQAVVVTDVGMIPMTDFSEYVQMGDEEISPASQGVMPVANNSFNADSLMSAEDRALLNLAAKPAPSLDRPLVSSQHQNSQPVFSPQQQTPAKPQESENYKIIDKLFTKFGDNMPKVTVDIDWNGFPVEQLTMLTDIFDVPKEEIAEYVIKKVLTMDNIKEKISGMI